jgi:hypothetical protein
VDRRFFYFPEIIASLRKKTTELTEEGVREKSKKESYRRKSILFLRVL